MKQIVFWVLSSLCVFGQFAQAQPSRGALSKDSFAITNVTVIPMTSDAVVRDANVIVREGRIAAIGPAATVPVPAGMRTVDGEGKYLIPRLADMHVHLFSDETAPKSVAADELGVMVANGVTAIRLMIGTPEHLLLRREVDAGRTLGPQFWIASPQFTGKKSVNASVVANPEQARAAVREAKVAGYDFIKLTLYISPEVFEAIVDEAARSKIRIVGHVDPQVGVARALAAGQHIEHLDNYAESILADNSPIKTSVSDLGVFRLKNWESIDHLDEGKLKRIAEATARSGTWTCPTLTLFKSAFAEKATDAELRARPDWRLQPPAHRDLYLRGHERYWKNPPSEARRKRYVEIRNRLVKEIADAGGKILAGSDTPEWFLGYGYTLHREMENLVAAGLTPYQALSAATRNPAEFLQASAEWGTVEPGKRADLVLLAANPLDDIRNTTKINAVCLGGRWLESLALEAMIQNAAKKLSGSEDAR